MASISRKIRRAHERKEKRSNSAFTLDRSLQKLRNLGIGLGGALVLLATPPFGIAGDGFTQLQDGKTTIFKQSAPKVFNRMPSYNIGIDETHLYNQPSSSSIFVQRVMGGAYSSIMGQLVANGQVWIMNPGGVLIGPQATVNTAGFLASSLVMDEKDFFAGRYLLKQDGNGGFVINQGTINTPNGGYAILAGDSVVNGGYIQANLGEVVLAAGSAMTMDFSGDRLIKFAVDEKTAAKVVGPDGKGLTSAVLNAGTIRADGGRVTLTAKTAANVLENVVNNTGVIRAQTAVEKNGEIILMSGDEGIVVSSGILDVSGRKSDETGGTVKVLGAEVSLLDKAVVDASGAAGGGTILIGGNYQGKGSEPNSRNTLVDKEATILADALNEGDGGKVIVWSDKDTGFFGRISARGGGLAGNGGFAEVSGKQALTFEGRADLRSQNGTYGTLLLDPNSIYINGTGHTGTDSDIADTTIAANLQNANVTLSALNNVETAAAVNIDPADATAVNTRTLTLTAGNNVVIAHPFILTNSGGATSPSLMMNAATGIQLGADVTTRGGNVAFNNAVSLTGPSLLDTTGGGTNSGANITFGSTINGGQTLDLIAGTGNVAMSGNAGETSNLASFGVISANTASLGNLRTTDYQDVTATSVNLNGTNYASTGGPVTLTGAIRLGSNVLIQSGQAAGNNITLNGTVNGAAAGGQTLGLTAGSGNVTITDIVGGTSTLAGFAVSSAQTANLQDVHTTGVQAVTASTINLYGANYVSAGGGVTLTGATRLGTDIVVQSGQAVGNDITFTGAVDSSGAVPYSLDLTAGAGIVKITGATGGLSPLTSFLVQSAGSASLNNVRTTGNQSVTAGAISLTGTTYRSTAGSLQFTGPVDLAAGAVTSTVTSGGTAANSISFLGTIDDTARDTGLTLAGGLGTVHLAGSVGLNSLPASLTVTGAATADLANVKTMGSQAMTANTIILNGTSYASMGGSLTFTGAALLGNDMKVSSGAAPGNNITFTGTVNGGQALDLEAGLGGIAIAGAAGAVTPLASLKAVGATVDLNAVHTLGDQAVAANLINLNGTAYTSTGGSLAFTGTAALNSDVTATSGGTSGNTITFGKIDGAHNLNLSAGAGDVLFTGLVGDTMPLQDISILSARNVTTIGVRAGSFGETSGTGTTTLNGGAFTDGTVEALNTTGANGVNIATNTITVKDAITATGGGVALQATGGTLTIDVPGNITAAGAVSLLGVAGIATAGSVTTIADAAPVTYSSATTLTGDVIIDTTGGGVLAGSSVTFGTTVDGPYNLDVIAGLGNVTVTGAVGGTTPLLNFGIVMAGTANLNSLSTSSNQDINATTIALNGTNYQSSGGSIFFTGATSLNNNVTVTSGNSGNDVTFTGTVDGGRSLTVNSSGTTTFDGTVGGTAALTSLTTDASGNTALNGGAVTTTGAQTYNDAVTLGANTTLTGIGVTLGGTVNGAKTLAVNDSGTTTFGGAVGSTTALTSVTTDALGSTAVNGGAVTTTGAQTYNDAVTLGADAILTGVNVTFMSALDATGGARSLTVNGGSGNVVFNGNVGGGAALGALDASGHQVLFNAGVKATGLKATSDAAAGNQISVGAVTIDANGGALTFSSEDISLNAGAILKSTGAVNQDATFRGAVAGTSIGLGTGAAGTLNLSTAELGTVQNTFRSIVVGQDGQTGTVAIDNGAVLTLANTGLTIYANGTDGAVQQANTTPVTLTNAGSALIINGTDGAGTTLRNNITTNNGAISLNGSVLLGASSVLSSGNGAITVAGTANGTAGAPTEALTLTAGTGDITLSDVYGAGGAASTTGLTAVTITSARNVSLNGNIGITGALTQTAGSGTTLFAASKTTNAGTVAIAANDVSFDGTAATDSGNINLTTGHDIVFGAAGALTSGSGTVTLLAGNNIALGKVGTSGTVNLTATAGGITDSNGGTNNVTASTLNATAAVRIGEVGTNGGILTLNNVLAGPANALETAVSTLNLTTTKAIGATEIAVDNTLAGTLTPSVTLPTGDGNQAWIRNSQDLNVLTPLAGGTARLDSRPNNNYGFIAATGTLTVQNTAANPLNIGTSSSLSLQGGTAVAGLGGSTAGTADVVARDFLLKTGAGGGNVSFNTDVTNLETVVTGAGKTLTVHQVTAATASGLNIMDLDGDGKSVATNAGAISLYQDNKDKNLTLIGSAAAPGFAVDAGGADIRLEVTPGPDPVNEELGNGAGKLQIGADATNHFVALTTDGSSQIDTGTLIITGGVNIFGSVHATAGRTIRLTAPASDIIINQNGVASSGALTLDAGGEGNIEILSSARVSVHGSSSQPGDLTVRNADTFTMDANSAITVDGGMTIQNIENLTTLHDITLGTGNFTTSSVGNVIMNGTLNADGHAVTMDLRPTGGLYMGGSLTMGTGALIDKTGELTIRALNNIGTSAANPINVNATDILLETTGVNQSIYLSNTPTAKVSHFAATTNGGDLIYMQQGQDLAITGDIATKGGSVEIVATDSITLASGGSLRSGGGNVLVSADSDTNGSGTVVFSGAGTGPGNNAIVYSNGGNVDAFGETISLKDYAIDSGSGMTTLTAGRQAASNGSITGSAGGGADVTGGTINLNVTNTSGGTVIGTTGTGNGLDINPAAVVNARVTGASAVAKSVNIAGTGGLTTGIINTDGNLSLTSAGTTSLGTTTVGGNLDLSSTGAITDSGTLLVTGTTSLAAGTGNDITLDSVANDFGGTVSVVSSRNVTLVDVNNIIIGDINAATSANLTAANSILNDGIAGTRLSAPAANLIASTGTVGVWNAPVEVDVTDRLNINAGGAQNGWLSVNLQGRSLDALHVDSHTPGMIMFNSASPGAPLANGRFIFINNAVQNNYGEGTAQNTARLANEYESYVLTLDIFGNTLFAPYTGLIKVVDGGVAPALDERAGLAIR